MSAAAPTALTAAEYLERERAAEFKSEYHAGEVVGLAGTSPVHGRIVTRLVTLLETHLLERPFSVYPSDLRVAAPSMDAYVYPDVIVTCGEERYDDARSDTLLNPLLVVEVHSTSTEAYDRGDKFAVYRAIPSLREYVLVSQARPCVERYVRLGDGTWRYDAVIGTASSLALESVPVTLPLSEVYRKTGVLATS